MSSLNQILRGTLQQNIFENANVLKVVSTALAIGNNDVYLVPAGYKAIIVQSVVYNNTGGAASVYLAYKRGGNYTRISANSAVAANQYSNTAVNFTFVFSPGDTIAINSAAAIGRAHLKIALIPSVAPIQTVFSNTTATISDVQFYVVPSGKTARILSASSLNLTNTNVGTVVVCNDTGGTVVYSLFNVPNGQIKDFSHQVAAVSLTTGLVGQLQICDTMMSGDQLIINTSSLTNNSIWWVTVIEE